jgi:hypothetical protein
MELRLVQVRATTGELNMKLATLALALLASVAPALAAPGGRTVHTKAGPARVDVPCKLALYGAVSTGPCLIATIGKETMYEFSNGARYVLKQDRHDQLAGILFHSFAERNIQITAVKALGDCWMGDGVLLCAK